MSPFFGNFVQFQENYDIFWKMMSILGKLCYFWENYVTFGKIMSFFLIYMSF